MELRTLKYFLAVAEEGNISNAAKLLHVSQPTLSRQLASLEQEFGRELYTRGRSGIELNEHGLILQHYANSIVSLSEKAEAEMSMPAKSVRGTVHIAAGECKGMALVAEAICRVRASYPDITFVFTSGNTVALKEDLIRGFHDVMLECEVHSHAKMNVMRMPIVDTWGVLMRSDDELASKDAITPEDLLGRQLVLSQQGQTRIMDSWFGDHLGQLNVSATYNLPLNCKFLVRGGVGIAVTYEGLIDCQGGDLCFRPLDPPVESIEGMVWRKSMPSKQTQVFLDTLKQVCAEYAGAPSAHNPV
ncbi:MAG: LysR family transcriptional regulator [Coriobacteriaceae bacterium]|nr:LysR family transcriptional regulator [Coriobacteriaceae bacterium]